eukprot:2775917-Rhodomonas_salina.1
MVAVRLGRVSCTDVTQTSMEGRSRAVDGYRAMISALGKSMRSVAALSPRVYFTRKRRSVGSGT